MIFRSNDQINTTAFILTFYPISVPNDLQKTPIFRFASKKIFFLAKNSIFKFCLLLSRGITGGMKTFVLTFYPVSEPSYLQKTHPKFVLLAKNYFFLAKKLIFKFCLLLSRGTIGGMKTVYFIVLSRLSTKLSTKKHANFVLLAKIIFSGKNFDFRILLITFKRQQRRYENHLF